MASTIPLSRTTTLASQFVRNAPLVFASQNNDPALSNADWVKQMILSPPFAWRWNRVGASYANPLFTTQVGVSDYKVTGLSNFGWIEKAVAYDPANGYQAWELKTDLLIAQETVPNQPTTLTAQYDDGAGGITFRLFPAPEKVYNVTVEYQQSASLFTATSNTWAPIPDYLSVVYNSGFQARTYAYWGDPRWQGEMQLFFQLLTEYSEGLSEIQKNLWLQAKLNTIRQSAAVQSGKR
jgi:hypothetical protein